MDTFASGALLGSLLGDDFSDRGQSCAGVFSRLGRKGTWTAGSDQEGHCSFSRAARTPPASCRVSRGRIMPAGRDDNHLSASLGCKYQRRCRALVGSRLLAAEYTPQPPIEGGTVERTPAAIGDSMRGMFGAIALEARQFVRGDVPLIDKTGRERVVASATIGLLRQLRHLITPSAGAPNMPRTASPMPLMMKIVTASPQAQRRRRNAPTLVIAMIAARPNEADSCGQAGPQKLLMLFRFDAPHRIQRRPRPQQGKSRG